MKEITMLDNPNSVVQMKGWLADRGLETDTLGKKAVAGLLKTAPEPLRRVLELRGALAKSSVKKYRAMENAVCADGRARGMFQFYGANRSGRWSGRIIQFQILPQNHLPDLAHARALLRAGDFEALSMLYDSVPRRSRSSSRGVHPSPAASLSWRTSELEARVIWFAGNWKTTPLQRRRYLCARLPNVPCVVVKHGNGHLRQKARSRTWRVSRGQLVLTDMGLIPSKR
jgi:DNA polymerase